MVNDYPRHPRGDDRRPYGGGRGGYRDDGRNAGPNNNGIPSSNGRYDSSRNIPTGPRGGYRSNSNIPTGPRDKNDRDGAERSRPQDKQENVERSKEKESQRDASVSAQTTQPTAVMAAAANETTDEQNEEILPAGWTKTMSRSHGRYFYFHEATGKTSWTKPDPEEMSQTEQQQQNESTPSLPAQTVQSTVAEEAEVKGKDEEVVTDKRDDKSVEGKSTKAPPTGPSSAGNISAAYANRRNNGQFDRDNRDRDRVRRRSPSPRRDDSKRYRSDEGRRSPPRRDDTRYSRNQAPYDRERERDRRPPPISTPVSAGANFVTRDFARNNVTGSGPNAPTSGFLETDRSRGSSAQPAAVGKNANSAPVGNNNRWGSKASSESSTPAPSSASKDAVGPANPNGSQVDDAAAKRAELAEKRRKAEEEIKRLREEEERLEKEEEEKKRQQETDKARQSEEEENKLKKQNQERGLPSKPVNQKSDQVEDDAAWRARREAERRELDAAKAKESGSAVPKPLDPAPSGPRGRSGPPSPRRQPYPPRPDSGSYRDRAYSPPRGPPRPSRGPDPRDLDRSLPPRRFSPPPYRGPPVVRRDSPPPFRRDDSYNRGGPPRGPPRTFAEPMSEQARSVRRSPEPARPFNHRPLAERMSRPPPDERFDPRDTRRR